LQFHPLATVRAFEFFTITNPAFAFITRPLRPTARSIEKRSRGTAKQAPEALSARGPFGKWIRGGPRGCFSDARESRIEGEEADEEAEDKDPLDGGGEKKGA